MVWTYNSSLIPSSLRYEQYNSRNCVSCFRLMPSLREGEWYSISRLVKYHPRIEHCGSSSCVYMLIIKAVGIPCWEIISLVLQLVIAWTKKYINLETSWLKDKISKCYAQIPWEVSTAQNFIRAHDFHQNPFTEIIQSLQIYTQIYILASQPPINLYAEQIVNSTHINYLLSNNCARLCAFEPDI